ncbi:MAG: glycosyltransferase family 39 protein [Verrucomicrobia bacterium]|nr:glycosyltransferase family 39 protein [Verrucomicrobiota bacterium]
MIRRLTRSGLEYPRRLLFWTLLAGVLLRLVSSGQIGVSYDEAYYAALSRHLGLSYFDHPPLLMWLLAGAGWMTGSDSPLLLRGAMSLLFVGSSLLMYQFTSLLFDRSAGAYAVLLLNLSLLFGVFIGGWPSPDAPLTFFLLAAMTCVAHIVFRNGNPGLLWPLAGVFMGFAMLSKYSAALTAIGAFMGFRSLSNPGVYWETEVSIR